jgi:hypothetical protein
MVEYYKLKVLYTKDILLYIPMDISKIKRRNGDRRKSVLITIRITSKLSKWLKEKDYSPTGIFYEAVKELRYEEEENV